MVLRAGVVQDRFAFHLPHEIKGFGRAHIGTYALVVFHIGPTFIVRETAIFPLRLQA
jgi:hypothetical protein